MNIVLSTWKKERNPSNILETILGWYKALKLVNRLGPGTTRYPHENNETGQLPHTTHKG